MKYLPHSCLHRLPPSWDGTSEFVVRWTRPSNFQSLPLYRRCCRDPSPQSRDKPLSVLLDHYADPTRCCYGRFPRGGVGGAVEKRHRGCQKPEVIDLNVPLRALKRSRQQPLDHLLNVRTTLRHAS